MSALPSPSRDLMKIILLPVVPPPHTPLTQVIFEEQVVDNLPSQDSHCLLLRICAKVDNEERVIRNQVTPAPMK